MKRSAKETKNLKASIVKRDVSPALERKKEKKRAKRVEPKAPVERGLQM